MSKTVAELEADLAAAKEAEAAEREAERQAAEAAAAEEARKQLVRDEIAGTEDSIKLLEERIAARRQRIAELQAQL